MAIASHRANPQSSAPTGGNAGRVPAIALSHGAALWVLSELGFRGGSSVSTFNAYLKSLRRLGIPFTESEVGHGAGHPVVYGYRHLMEISLALAMRFYLAIPDKVLSEIVRWRPQLLRLYRRAFTERNTGRGAPIRLGQAPNTCEMHGAYLDLRMRFAGGQLMRLGPPQLLTPFEAIRRFANVDPSSRATMPLPLSALSTEIVRLATAAPHIRPGPRPAKVRSS
jgi:hypothetical protein